MWPPCPAACARRISVAGALNEGDHARLPAFGQAGSPLRRHDGMAVVQSPGSRGGPGV
jgi:hypothetical protein